MSQKIYKDLLKTILVWGGFLLLVYAVIEWIGADFETQKPTFNLKDKKFISIENEIKIGAFFSRQFDREIIEQDDRNETLFTSLEQIKLRLFEPNQSGHYEYHIKIIDSDEKNAFALPGGYIFIYSGLLKLCDHPEELAAVLAHEMAHVEYRHGTNKLIREVGLTALLTILAGGDTQIIGELSKFLINNSFSREAETEADAFALDYLKKSNIDPKYFISFFEKLNQENLSYDKKLSFFMSHPHNDKRIQMAKEKLENGKNYQPIRINWKQTLEVLE